MVRRNSLLVLGTTMAALAAASCGGSTTNADGGDAHTGGDAGPAMTYTYVINALTIDMDTSTSNPHTGFNLDGLCTSGMGMTMEGCTIEDYYSAIDPDQNCPTVDRSNPAGTTYDTCTPMPNPGCMVTAGVEPTTMPMSCQGCVDNQLPTLANTIGATGTDLRSTLSSQISANSLAILAQISDVNDLTNDPSVTVSLFVGYPTRMTDCTEVMAGAEYVVSQSSLNAGGTTLADAKFKFTGSIVNGRVRVATMPTDTFNLPLPSVMGASLSLALHSPQFRANVTASGLALGNLGGAVNGSELVTTVCQALPMYCSLATTAIQGLVDIDTSSGICSDTTTTPPTFGQIGLGLGLTGVLATIRATSPIVASAPAGACGASTADGG